jgi:hypothetical protein
LVDRVRGHATSGRRHRLRRRAYRCEQRPCSGGFDLVLGGAGRNLTANRAAALLGQVGPTGAPAVTRHQLARELVADVRELDRRIAAVEARIKTAVA